MTELILAERKSAVLTPSSLACLKHTPTVNLTAGCATSAATVTPADTRRTPAKAKSDSTRIR